MILSGPEIKKHIGKEIIIEPFDEKCLNPSIHIFIMVIHKKGKTLLIRQQKILLKNYIDCKMFFKIKFLLCNKQHSY